MKTCRDCGEAKAAEQFYVVARNKDGLSSYCRKCCNRRGREREMRERSTPEGREAYNERARRLQRRAKFRRHGVPEELIDQLVEEAGTGVCHACGRAPGVITIPNKSAQRLHADHDHDTNLYRGLLCQPCNSVLGLVEDDPARLQALIDYLARHQMSVLQDLALLGK